MSSNRVGGGSVGLIRKTASISTLGLVNLSSNKEKARRNERRSNQIAARAARAERKIARATFIAERGRTPEDVIRGIHSPGVVLDTRQPMSSPARWAPDPRGRHELRWWNGNQWTEHVVDAETAGVDALAGDVQFSPVERGSVPVGAQSEGLTEQLTQLAELRAAGVLTDEEFVKAKAKLLE